MSREMFPFLLPLHLLIHCVDWVCSKHLYNNKGAQILCERIYYLTACRR